MSMIPMRPLRFGEVVDGALQLYRRDFGLYYLIALLAAFPGYVLTVAWGVDLSTIPSGSDADPVETLTALGRVGVVIWASAAMAWVGWIGVAVAMAHRIGNRPTSVGRAYRGAFRSLPSALGATVVALLIFAVVFFFVLLAGALLSAVFVGSGSVAGAIGSTAFTLLMGVAATALWLGATFGILPAVVVERRGPMGALGRSFSLCRGGLLRVTGVMVVAMIINFAPSIGVSALVGLGDLFTSPDAVGEITATEQWIMNTVDLVVGPLTTPFMVGSMMVLFHDRRVRSEAYDLETLAGEMAER